MSLRSDEESGFENISNPENNNSDEDDISGEFDDDLDFTLPHASSARDDISSEAETLTSIDDVQDLDFSHPRNIGVSDKEHRSSSLSDDVLPHEQPYVSPSLMSNEENVSTSNAETTLEDNHAFEQNIADPSEMAINESQDMSTSLDSFMEDYVNKPATPMSQSGHEIENQEITNNLSPLDAFMAGNADDNDVIKQPVQDFDIQDNHSFASELDTFVEDENSIPNRELSSPIANNDGNISPLDAFMNSDTQTEGHIRQSVQSLDNQNGNTSISELDEFMEDKNATSLDINDNSSATDDDGSISPLDAFMADRNSETSNQPLDEAPVVSVEKAAVTNDEFSPQRESALDSREQSQSRYSTQLDKIREALTSDNIDISSLDQPIELDDYSDDENVGKDDYDDILSNISTPSDAVNAPSSSDDQYDASSQQGSSENDENWEWEYVDEDGNQIPENGEDDGDWEWEYVEDDSDDANVDDNKK